MKLLKRLWHTPTTPWIISATIWTWLARSHSSPHHIAVTAQFIAALNWSAVVGILLFTAFGYKVR